MTGGRGDIAAAPGLERIALARHLATVFLHRSAGERGASAPCPIAKTGG
jgi:hypothetical protein